MARTDTLGHFLTDVADAIREKKGTSETITASDFDTEIANLPSGTTNSKLTILESDVNGYPTKAKIENVTALDAYFFQAYNTTTAPLWSKLEYLELPDEITRIGEKCFWGNKTVRLTKLPSSLQTIQGNETFYNCRNITIKKIPDGVTTTLPAATFMWCTSITQLSAKNAYDMRSSNVGYAVFGYCTGLIAVWFGTSYNPPFQRFTFKGCTNLKRIYINQKRSIVEAMADYQYAFSDNTVSADVIICNDDDDFITQEEFDAIDWSTYVFEEQSNE